MKTPHSRGSPHLNRENTPHGSFHSTEGPPLQLHQIDILRWYGSEGPISANHSGLGGLQEHLAGVLVLCSQPPKSDVTAIYQGGAEVDLGVIKVAGGSGTPAGVLHWLCWCT